MRWALIIALTMASFTCQTGRPVPAAEPGALSAAVDSLEAVIDMRCAP